MSLADSEARTSSQPLAQQPAHLSFSAHNALNSCGERFRLERGLGIRGLPSWAQVGGSAVHSCSEVYDRGLIHDDFDVVAVWDDEFEKAIEKQEHFSQIDSTEFRATGRASKANPNKEDRAWWEENGPLFVQSWITWRQVSPWEILEWNGVLCIEIEANVELGGKPNKGFIDRVMVSPAGEIIVVDLKTGSMKPPPFQLGQYKVVLERLGIQATWGTYWSARTNTTSPPEDLTRFDEAWLDELYWRDNQILEQGLFVPNVDMHCSWCSVSDYCRAFGGSRWREATGSTLVSLEIGSSK